MNASESINSGETVELNDVIKSELKHPRKCTLRIRLTTTKQCEFANQVLAKPNSGWQIENAKNGESEK